MAKRKSKASKASVDKAATNTSTTNKDYEITTTVTKRVGEAEYVRAVLDSRNPPGFKMFQIVYLSVETVGDAREAYVILGISPTALENTWVYRCENLYETLHFTEEKLFTKDK